MNPTLLPSHILLDEQGRAWIEDTNTKVIEVATAHLAYGWSADELARQLPHLTLGQVHSALAHYYDHQTTFDREIDRQTRAFESARLQTLNSPISNRLRGRSIDEH
jgi:uncharacterized protein (DUF433 family)